MFNPISNEQQQELRSLIYKHGLQEVEELIVSLAQNAIVLETTTYAPDSPNLSQLGGLPLVPEGWEWPKGLAFLGQIDLEAIAPYDHNRLLPPGGLLLFFFDNYGGDESGMPAQVQFVEDTPGGTREVHRAPAPPDYLPISLCNDGDGREIYKSRSIIPRNRISLPTMYSRAWEAICYTKDADGSEINLDDAYSNLLSELEGRRTHQLLGHHAFMDGNADEEAWSAANGVSSRLIGKQISDEDREKTLAHFDSQIQHWREHHLADSENGQRMVAYYQKQRENYLRYLSHKEEADAQLAEWVLLFQMDSDDDICTMFNDAGFAYFMIRQPDLAARRFDRVFASLWSS